MVLARRRIGEIERLAIAGERAGHDMATAREEQNRGGEKLAHERTMVMQAAAPQRRPASHHGT
jgi:hypothetical protein